LRLAISAVAVVVGLVLACVIFGQPALYLSEARQQWNSLFAARPAPSPDAASPDPPVAQVQQQVTALRDELAVSQAAADQARQQLAALRQQLAASQTAADQARQQPVTTLPLPVPPERPASPAAAGSGPERRDTPKPPLPPPAPKPKAETAAARVEPDEMSSVLARLRQRPYGAAQPDNAAQQGEARSVSEAPRPPSLARQRLERARTALLDGRTDDARRLLQEVQVQLVFRPIGPGVEDAPPAGQGAAAVARALGSLGGDPAQSQQLIERAIEEVAGTSSQGIESASGPSTGGYAPAYPSRFTDRP
jgi:hypothetical protein